MKMEFEEDREFTQKASKLITDEEQRALEITLTRKPDSGTSIGGGLRKIRLPKEGSGKSGGHRVIYFWYVQKDLIRLLDIFTKNKKENVTSNELKNLINKSK